MIPTTTPRTLRLSIAATMLALGATGVAQDRSPTTIGGDPRPTFAVDLDSLEYRPSPIDRRIETAMVFGSRDEPGLYATHARVGAGAVVPPHTHPNTLTTVVTSGTAFVGTGTTIDEDLLVAYPVGSVFVTPAGSPHFIVAKDGDFSILDHGSGPSGVTLLRRRAVDQ